MSEEQPQLNRRNFLRVGGSTMAGAALLAATPAFSAGLKEGDLPNGTAGENSASVSSQPTAGPGGDQTTSDILVETLVAWGATHVFGLVGDGIAGLIERVKSSMLACATKRPLPLWPPATPSSPASSEFVLARRARRRAFAEWPLRRRACRRADRPDLS
jgi:hypothetical protein